MINKLMDKINKFFNLILRIFKSNLKSNSNSLNKRKIARRQRKSIRNRSLRNNKLKQTKSRKPIKMSKTKTIIIRKKMERQIINHNLPTIHINHLNSKILMVS